MKLFKLLIWLLPVIGFVGCTSTFKVIQWDTRSVVLAKVEDDNLNSEVFELQQNSDGGEITLLVRSEQTTQHPEMGLSLKEIDKNLAQEKMLTPYSGLFVRDVKSGGPAAAAGVVPGDIVTTVNGTEVLYLDLYNHILQNSAPENTLTFALLRGFEQKQAISLNITPEAKQVVLPSTRAVPLEPPQVSGPGYAGIIIGTLPAEWTEKIYGERRPTVLISRVIVGSPAYRAGLRGGDRILAVNGQYFETATALKEWILEHGVNEETVIVEVFQKQGDTYTAEVDLERTDASSRIYCPFVFDLEDDIRRTDWDFGPFGIVCNYNGRYLRPSSREINYRREISCILGLVNYTWSPQSGRLRLLWFIRFGSD